MIDAGFPVEDDVYKPEHQWVFSFPVAVPDSSITADQMNALEQLELWLAYQNHYCEHKPSMTVYVKEHEWMEVGAWVYKHFDSVSGIAFLPYSEHGYKQAPYEELTEVKYQELLGKFPKTVDWGKLSQYEKDDTSVNHREFACSGTSCEIVDLVKN
jgi:ribonucleoside-diphosphate reductase alpha chain